MCREDDVREVRGLGGVVFPSPTRGEEGAGGLVVAGSAKLGLASRIVETSVVVRLHFNADARRKAR